MVQENRELYDLIVIGGGAAGFFGALAASEQGSHKKIAIIEKSLKVLSKVRISGGGRCNVTHACFDPKILVNYYPRGSKELLGPFHQFQPKDTIAWFAEHGVSLKTEEDGRMFPTTDSSETIIECLMQSAQDQGIGLKTGVAVEKISKENEQFVLETKQGQLLSKNILLASGSSPQGHVWAQNFGHTISELVPSLFTFNVPTSHLLDLAGIALPNVSAFIEGTGLKENGPLLLTHWGFSGPAILRLSAWGARKLHALDYRATLQIDWTGGASLKPKILELKQKNAAQTFTLEAICPLPKNLAKRLQEQLSMPPKRFSELSNKDIDAIIALLTASRYSIEGKTTYKQEFVTCGGISLSEVNFKTMQSRLCPGLYFAGEILDIDGITGGFNFQNAWTTGWIAGTHLRKD